jgi:hypothetical protein
MDWPILKAHSGDTDGYRIFAHVALTTYVGVYNGEVSACHNTCHPHFKESFVLNVETNNTTSGCYGTDVSLNLFTHKAIPTDTKNKEESWYQPLHRVTIKL